MWSLLGSAVGGCAALMPTQLQMSQERVSEFRMLGEVRAVCGGGEEVGGAQHGKTQRMAWLTDDNVSGSSKQNNIIFANYTRCTEPR